MKSGSVCDLLVGHLFSAASISGQGVAEEGLVIGYGALHCRSLDSGWHRSVPNL